MGLGHPGVEWPNRCFDGKCNKESGKQQPLEVFVDFEGTIGNRSTQCHTVKGHYARLLPVDIHQAGDAHQQKYRPHKWIDKKLRGSGATLADPVQRNQERRGNQRQFEKDIEQQQVGSHKGPNQATREDQQQRIKCALVAIVLLAGGKNCQWRHQ